MEMALQVANIKKNFGSVRAVDGISFQIPKGEIFGFLGPNGAGKTTTIRILMDFIRPSSGNVKIMGLDAQENSVELKRKIGYLSDTAKFYDHWSAKKHLDYQRAIRGDSKSLDKLIRLFGLSTKSKFSSLSSGNKRKLSIILALMNDPEILILDEPTTALDPILQNAFLNYIDQFAKSGGTVFMSSHNLGEVEKICDRVGIIREGKMVAVKKISELKLMKMYDVSFHAEGVEPKSFASKNVKIESHTEGLMILKVKGDINPVITELAKYKVKDLEITHVSLEDIFMEFYSNPKEKNA